MTDHLSNTIELAKHRHHEQARLLALGFTIVEVATMLSVDVARIALLIDDPTFRQLVAVYEKRERGEGSCVAFATRLAA